MIRLSVVTLQALADVHIRMYENRIRNVHNANIEVCQSYLRIWQGVKACEAFDELDKQQLGEITDACFEGSYDKYLSEDERKALDEYRANYSGD